MATRANQARTSFEHVHALNMVDVEFYNEQKVLDVWNKYVDHL